MDIFLSTKSHHYRVPTLDSFKNDTIDITDASVPLERNFRGSNHGSEKAALDEPLGFVSDSRTSIRIVVLVVGSDTSTSPKRFQIKLLVYRSDLTLAKA